MRRRANGDEFRSNVHRGGTVEPVELTPEYEQAAVRSAQIMGLRVAGVDMLEGNDGPLVMEVNSSPGLEGIEAATNLDVAGAIVDYAEKFGKKYRALSRAGYMKRFRASLAAERAIGA